MAHRTADPDDFRLALRDLLRDGDVATEVRELAERLDMELASPGDWERAKHESPEAPDSDVS